MYRKDFDSDVCVKARPGEDRPQAARVEHRSEPIGWGIITVSRKLDLRRILTF